MPHPTSDSASCPRCKHKIDRRQTLLDYGPPPVTRPDTSPTLRHWIPPSQPRDQSGEPSAGCFPARPCRRATLAWKADGTFWNPLACTTPSKADSGRWKRCPWRWLSFWLFRSCPGLAMGECQPKPRAPTRLRNALKLADEPWICEIFVLMPLSEEFGWEKTRFRGGGNMERRLFSLSTE